MKRGYRLTAVADLVTFPAAGAALGALATQDVSGLITGCVLGFIAVAWRAAQHRGRVDITLNGKTRSSSYVLDPKAVRHTREELEVLLEARGFFRQPLNEGDLDGPTTTAVVTERSSGSRARLERNAGVKRSSSGKPLDIAFEENHALRGAWHGSESDSCLRQWMQVRRA